MSKNRRKYEEEWHNTMRKTNPKSLKGENREDKQEREWKDNNTNTRKDRYN